MAKNQEVRTKVRAAYINPENGIFLIQKPRYNKEKPWNFPGGEIGPRENMLDGLNRVIELEIGAYPIIEDQDPFYKYQGKFREGRITTFAYWSRIPESVFRHQNEGKISDEVIFKFFTLAEIAQSAELFTGATQDIVRSDKFLEKIMQIHTSQSRTR